MTSSAPISETQQNEAWWVQHGFSLINRELLTEYAKDRLCRCYLLSIFPHTCWDAGLLTPNAQVTLTLLYSLVFFCFENENRSSRFNHCSFNVNNQSVNLKILQAVCPEGALIIYIQIFISIWLIESIKLYLYSTVHTTKRQHRVLCCSLKHTLGAGWSQGYTGTRIPPTQTDRLTSTLKWGAPPQPAGPKGPVDSAPSNNEYCKMIK